jgi:hypothetical protein
MNFRAQRELIEGEIHSYITPYRACFGRRRQDAGQLLTRGLPGYGLRRKERHRRRLVPGVVFSRDTSVKKGVMVIDRHALRYI